MCHHLCLPEALALGAYSPRFTVARAAVRHPIALGAEVLNAVVDRAGIDATHVEDVIVGCVSQVGAQAGNIGRNMVLASKLPETVPGTAVDRQCGSSQQALHFAAQVHSSSLCFPLRVHLRAQLASRD